MKELKKLIERDSRDLKEESDRQKEKLRGLAREKSKKDDWFVSRFRTQRLSELGDG